MAELFLARPVGDASGRPVVLKRIARERATDTQFVQMFLDEARLAAQLRHPNIAQVFDIGRLGVSYYFTMEYVHGVTVEDLVDRSAQLKLPLPVDAILSILFGAAAGLQHAHERTGPDGKPLDIVHRDISPSNLMVSYDGHVKVVDFGVAKAQMSGRPETQAGEIKGKVGYLSPEQCRLQKLDRRSDLYSLGVVAWEMVTGKRLWKRETAFSTMAAIATEDVPAASEYRERLAPEIDHLIARLLATEVVDRFQSAGEVIHAIELVATTTRANTSPSQLAKLMRAMFGAPVEPWRVVRDTVNVTSSPIPEELDTHDEDPSIDTVEHKLTTVFSAIRPDSEDESGATRTSLVALDRLSTASVDAPLERALSHVDTSEVPVLGRPPSMPVRERASTEIIPENQPEPTEILPLEPSEPAIAATIIGTAPIVLPRPSSPAPLAPRPLPAGDPTVPLGMVIATGARVAPSGPQVPASGPQLPASGPHAPPLDPGPKQPRWPPPPHGHVGRSKWWIAAGLALGVALVLLVLVVRGNDRRAAAMVAPDAVVIVATAPVADAGTVDDVTAAVADAVAPPADVAAAIVDAAPAAVADAAPPDAADADDPDELATAKPQPATRRKLRTKPELNAAFRERRYKDIVAACGELGADDDRAVVCTLAACRAHAKQAQDWYRNVSPKQRDGTIRICKQAGHTITDVCATDLLACRK